MITMKNIYTLEEVTFSLSDRIAVLYFYNNIQFRITSVSL